MCVMMISSKKNNYQLKIFLQVKILKTTSHCAAELFFCLVLVKSY